jgi:hypothetical protein
MKTIQPVNTWINGSVQTATKFGMDSIFDNLEDSATFYYQLFYSTLDAESNEVLTQVAQGNLTISGADYENWNDSPNVNDAAYQWGATQLGLTIVA